jgi:hypothetical protein
MRQSLKSAYAAIGSALTAERAGDETAAIKAAEDAAATLNALLEDYSRGRDDDGGDDDDDEEDDEEDGDVL